MGGLQAMHLSLVLKLFVVLRIFEEYHQQLELEY